MADNEVMPETRHVIKRWMIAQFSCIALMSIDQKSPNSEISETEPQNIDTFPASWADPVQLFLFSTRRGAEQSRNQPQVKGSRR